MNIDDRFRRLTDSGNWDGLELKPRRAKTSRRVSLLFQVAAIAAVGTVVGVVVAVGLNSIRPGSPNIAATNTDLPLDFTQTPGMTTAAQGEGVPDTRFFAEWGVNHETFTVVTYGSSSCPWTPTDIRADDSSMTIVFAETSPEDNDTGLSGCTADLSPNSTTFPTPDVLDDTVPVDLTVTLGDETHTTSLYFEASSTGCTSTMLTARVSASELVDGVQYQDLVVMNTSKESCNLFAPMTASFVSAARDDDVLGDGFVYEPPFEGNGILGQMPPGAERVYRIGLLPATADCDPRPAESMQFEGAFDEEIAVADWHLDVCTAPDQQDFTITGPTIERTVQTNDWQD